MGTRSIWVVALYAVFVHAPTAASLLAFYPDWSVCYLLSPSRFHSGIPAALVLLNVAAPIAGFVLAGSGAAVSRMLQALRLGTGALALIAINTLLAVKRLVVVASYNEFHNNFGTEGVAGSALGYSLLLVSLLLGGTVVWSYHLLRGMSRRIARAPRRGRWAGTATQAQ